MRTDFSPTAASARDFYRLLTARVVPRPIAWVSSVSPEGVDNLAARSFFTVASTNPPIVQGLHGYGRRTLNLHGQTVYASSANPGAVHGSSRRSPTRTASSNST